MLDAKFEEFEVGDKVGYIGSCDDDNDLYAEFEENGFVHEVCAIEEESELIWVVGCPYAISAALVVKWQYD